MAGVQDSLDSRGPGGVDGGAVRDERASAADGGGHDEHLLGTLEGVLQRGWVGEVSGTDPDTALGEARGLVDVAHAHTHGLGW